MNTIGKLFMTLFIAATFVGCSSDDDGANDTSASLVGTWNITSLDYSGESATEFMGQSQSATFVGVGENFDTSITFTENPNEYTSSGSYDVVLTTTINGVEDTTTTPVDDFQSEGDWERNGDSLLFDGELVSVDTTIPTGMTINMSEATILELTDTTLRLSQDASEEISQDGITVSFSLTSEIVLTRQ